MIEFKKPHNLDDLKAEEAKAAKLKAPDVRLNNRPRK